MIGGGEIYRQALPMADRIHLTEVEANYRGDALFPDLAVSEWRVTDRVSGTTSAPPVSYITLDRIRA